eukprot:364622-Chlamydomonas_euryale.AAC.2
MPGWCVHPPCPLAGDQTLARLACACPLSPRRRPKPCQASVHRCTCSMCFRCVVAAWRPWSCPLPTPHHPTTPPPHPPRALVGVWVSDPTHLHHVLQVRSRGLAVLPRILNLLDVRTELVARHLQRDGEGRQAAITSGCPAPPPQSSQARP